MLDPPRRIDGREPQRAEQESQEKKWANRKLRGSVLVLHVSLVASFTQSLPLQAVLNTNSYISNI